MKFKKTEIASSGVKLETSSMTSESEVKSLLKGFWHVKIIAEKTTLMTMLIPFTTMTENLATLG